MSRPMIEYIKKNNNQTNLIGVEIGVYTGLNAKDILSVLSIKKMFLIDSYATYVEKGLITKVEYKKEFYETAKKNLNDFKDKIEFIVKKSIDAINDIPADVDFIYIDGSHKYFDVKKDIEYYYDKIKVNGIIGGHDINSPFILLAVILFAIKKGMIRNLFIKKPDWWIVKKRK